MWLLMLGLYSFAFIISVFVIIFFGYYVHFFVIGIISACLFAFLCGKLIRKFAFSDYSSASGEIADVHKEIKIVDQISVGGINPFGTRKYDNYSKTEVCLGVFIRDGEYVRSYFLNNGTEEHAKYYEAKGEAIHIWGTHFPVKLKIGMRKWLCPVCGEFNAIEGKYCSRCKKKIIK